MKKLLFIISVCLVIASCNNTKNREINKADQDIEANVIVKGSEAIIKEDIAFWNKKQIAVLNSRNWEKSKTNIILKAGTKIFVLEPKTMIDTTFTKVITPINIEGYISTSALKFSSLTPDSTSYFTRRNIKELKKYVEGEIVTSVNLWDHMTERNRIISQIYPNVPFALLEEKGEYAKIMTIDGNVGWCMKGWLK